MVIMHGITVTIVVAIVVAMAMAMAIAGAEAMVDTMVNDGKLTIAKQVCIVNNTHRKKNNNTTRVSNATQRQYVCVKTVCLRKDSMSA